MLLALVAVLPALWLDPRILNGEILWVKPAKFAISIVLYSFTLLWILSFIQTSPERDVQRTVRIASWIIAVMFLIEVVAIFGQAARGRISHFNNSTLEDSLIFNVMGGAILTLFIAHLAITVLFLRQRNDEIVLGSGLRAGLIVAALGMGIGYLMVAPTPDQIASFQQGLVPNFIGSHTVGAADGGPGMPVTGWSSTVGDLRIAHFFGMHAMQVLPLFAVWLRRKSAGNSPRNRGLVRVAAAMYAALTGLLTIQALRGQSLLNPDALTLMMFFACIFIGGLAVWWTIAAHTSRPSLQQTESTTLRDGRAPGMHV